MTTLIQDYKNLWSARKGVKKARTNLDSYYKSIIKDVLYGEFMWNLGMKELFAASLPKDEGQPDFKEKFVEAYESYSRICRATTCFFRLCHIMYKDTIFEQKLTIKEIGRCINNNEDGTIHEQFCDECKHFAELVQYQSLRGLVAAAERKRKDAKKQLFSHFWKQQTKGK